MATWGDVLGLADFRLAKLTHDDGAGRLIEAKNLLDVIFGVRAVKMKRGDEIRMADVAELAGRLEGLGARSALTSLLGELEEPGDK